MFYNHFIIMFRASKKEKEKEIMANLRRLRRFKPDEVEDME